MTFVKSLHSVERAFMKQKEHYEEELRRAGEVKVRVISITL